MKSGTPLVPVYLAVVALFVVYASSQGPEQRFFFSCQPITRIFVRHGALCFQQNATELSCRNETCRCSTPTPRPIPTFPPLPGIGNITRPPLPTLPPFPFPTIPRLPKWNCTAPAPPSNSTTPIGNTTTTAP